MKLEKVIILSLLMSCFLFLWGIFEYWQFKNFSLQNSIPLVSDKNSSQEIQTFPSPQPQPIKIIFGGDMMFDRHVREGIAKHGSDYPLGELTQFLSKADFAVANLEGPITSFDSKSLGSQVGSTNNYIFTFDPQTINILQSNNFLVVNLGNNHILNFGQAGLEQTYQYLDQGKVMYFGNTGKGPDLRTLVIEKKGVKIGFVNYNQFVSNSWIAVTEDIKQLRSKVDVLIVYTHWGNEYQTLAGEPIITQAHQLIDLGADTIIGSHPHVVQQKEIYQDKVIYYSLGNFVFDQYFQPEVQEGLLVILEIDPQSKNLTFSEQNIKMIPGGKTILITENDN